MDFEDFFRFAKSNGIDFDQARRNMSSIISVHGTFVQGTTLYSENSNLNLEYKENKWGITVTKQKRVLYVSESIDEEFSFNLTFLTFNPDIFFYANNVVELAKFTAILSIIQNQREIKVEVDDFEKSMFLLLLSDRSKKNFTIAYKKSAQNLDFTFLFSPKIGNIYAKVKDDFILYGLVLPYAGVEEQPELPPQACFYDSNLPDKVYSPNYDDALIRGIVALSQKVEKDKEKVEKPNESLLEIAKLEFEAENDKIKNTIDIEIENLKREMISGAIFENTLDDFETTIAHKLNFGGSAAITGKEAASLLRSLNK